MNKNSYWILTSKSKKGGGQLIAELTPDGMVYLWPMTAAKQQLQLHPEKDQDLDALLADGDFIEKSGFYHSIFDFMSNSKYTPELYALLEAGEFDSIRACREFLLRNFEPNMLICGFLRKRQSITEWKQPAGESSLK